MNNTKSLEKRLKLMQKQVTSLKGYVEQLNKENAEYLKKDALKRKIYDLGFRINSLRREKHRVEAELKKLFETKK